VSDFDTVVVDSLKALDPNRPIREADLCLFVCNEGEQACGQLIEAGAALAAGKRVFVVSPYEWTFAHHPRCRIFPTLEAAVDHGGGSRRPAVVGPMNLAAAQARPRP
jgi:hypothetical protein